MWALVGLRKVTGRHLPPPGTDIPSRNTWESLMSDFTALIRQRRTITVSGIDVTVYALSLEQIGALIAAHSKLAGALESTDGNVVESIMAAGPAAIADVIIAATNGDIPRAVALEINAVAAVEIITATAELTLPEEEGKLGNVLAGVTRLFNRIGSSASATSSKS